MKKQRNIWRDDMLQNLYRGLTKDTKVWIEGDLIQDLDAGTAYISRWIHHYGDSGLRIERKETEVIPESVGQCIGKVDRKGKIIFSGDILEDAEGIRMTVEWSDRCAGWSLRSKDWAYEHFFGEAVEEEDVKVIGNVFEDDALVDGSSV